MSIDSNRFLSAATQLKKALACILYTTFLLGGLQPSFAASPTKVGDRFTLHPQSEQWHTYYSMATLSNGDAIITRARSLPGSGFEILAQRYSQNGQPVGEAITVTPLKGPNIGAMQVAGLKDGGFVVIWRDNKPHPQLDGTFGQIFNSDGSKRGGIFDVNADKKVFHVGASILGLRDGGFAIAYYPATPLPDGKKGIFLQRFNADGSLNGAEQQLSSTTTDTSYLFTTMASLNNGGFVVAWTQSKAQNSDIYVQRFDEAGNFVGAPFIADNHANGIQTSPSLDTLHDGSLILAYTHYEEGIPYTYFQRFNADGTLLNNAKKVKNLALGSSRSPSVSVISNDAFVISWAGRSLHNSENGIFARAFASDGTEIGEEFKVSGSAKGFKHGPLTGSLGNNNFLIIWTNSDSYNHAYSMNAQQYSLISPSKNELAAFLPSYPVYEGNQISLPLTVKGEDVYGIDATISLDAPSVASFTGGSYGEFLPSHERLTIPLDYIDDQWQSAVSIKAPHSAKSGEGKYATAELIAHQPGTLNLTVNAQFTAQNGTYIYQSQENYTLTVLESVFLSGNVADLAINGDYTQITLFINGSPVHIQSDGTFKYQSALGPVTLSISAPGFLTGEKKLALSPNQADIDFGAIALVAGDQNGDNSIDIADLTQLMSAYRSTSLDPEYHPAADLNRDNKINLQDLTLLGKNFGKQGPFSL
ncbi:hypothetical protein A7985_12315 [Pseudoalteromonas luteoviolacea]|uniref:Dockerin domain-containing protein n=1 Tax=Pseudoalteromonas luteoviolacea TaxID=43657 RepID=A0A1C0TR31_9GAMM|nr:dockerin type I domain-containing protein [Pseudoalteromonas luteoviolacea]OCQ21394.1 hypothetical protein A7985_12315 [Pseudoalteromonas luteoviolacea]